MKNIRIFIKSSSKERKLAPSLLFLYIIACGLVSPKTSAQKFDNLILNSGFEQCLDANQWVLTNQKNNPPSCPSWWSLNHTGGIHIATCNKQNYANILSYGNERWFFTPHTGEGFVLAASTGKFLGDQKVVRRFIRTALKNVLEPGCKYKIELYVKPLSRRRASAQGAVMLIPFCNDFGLQLSVLDTTTNLLSGAPHLKTHYFKFLERDTLNYRKLTYTFEADRAYQYLTFGSFRPDDSIFFYFNDTLSKQPFGGAGWYIDDVSLQKIVPESYKLSLPENLYLCQDSVITLTVPDYGGSVLWSSGSTRKHIDITQSGKYWVEVKGPCFNLFDTVVVNYYEYPIFMFTDTSICSNEALQITLDNDYLYRWSDVPKQEFASTRKLKKAGYYSVAGITECGEVPLGSFNLEVESCEISATLPNAFTPNGDRKNELFIGYLKNADYVEFKVFDRWGTNVYTSFSQPVSWDGVFRNKFLPPGVYTYQIMAKNNHHYTFRKTGYITILK